MRVRRWGIARNQSNERKGLPNHGHWSDKILDGRGVCARCRERRKAHARCTSQGVCACAANTPCTGLCEMCAAKLRISTVQVSVPARGRVIQVSPGTPNTKDKCPGAGACDPVSRHGGV